uniref:Immunoglobulin V-set domain-containing protein n=1 Tax=Anas platyrhynchos platyrhynchos TaxID=8840 RepID=A0A493T8Z4_ANAPP
VGSMLLLPVLFHPISPHSLPGGDAQAVPVQSPAMRRQVKGSSARMECRLSSNAIMHWYKQLPGQRNKRILYVSGQSPMFDDGSDGRKWAKINHTKRHLALRTASSELCPNADTSSFNPALMILCHRVGKTTT